MNEKPDHWLKFNSVSTMKNLIDALWNVVQVAESEYCDGHEGCKTGDSCPLCTAVRMVREVDSRQRPHLWRRVVKLRCPKCEIEQEAEECHYESDPFPAYVHECVECKYMIGESDWDYAVGGGGMPPISSVPKPKC